MAKRLQHTLTQWQRAIEREIYAIQLKSHFNEDKTRQNDPRVNELKHTVKTICLLELTTVSMETKTTKSKETNLAKNKTAFCHYV